MGRLMKEKIAKAVVVGMAASVGYGAVHDTKLLCPVEEMCERPAAHPPHTHNEPIAPERTASITVVVSTSATAYWGDTGDMIAYRKV
jgi:hypothetical protein